MDLPNLAASFDYESAIELIGQYAWLAEFRIVDFLTADYWNKCENIPTEWRQWVVEKLQVPEADYAKILMQLTEVSLSKTQVVSNNDSVSALVKKCYELSFVLSSFETTKSKSSLPEKRRNVKLKKTYEIETAGGHISKILKDNGLPMAADIGAGQGYLALELLKNNPMLTIQAIESSDIQVHGTNERLKEASSLNTSLKDRLIMRQIRLDAGKELDLDSKQRYLMYSLHACGSLSECMVELFARNDMENCQALFNVGCCYNLIDEGLPGVHFPMSSAVASLWSGELTRNMKMVACQAPFRWIHRPEQTRKFFKRHFYRALLELLIAEENEGDLSSLDSLGNIGDAELESFGRYGLEAFKSMKYQSTHYHDVESLNGLYFKYRYLEPCMAFMWTMRAMLGPVIEAIILYDRYRFLDERIGSSLSHLSLVPLFDPLKSPRNMALIATKKYK